MAAALVLMALALPAGAQGPGVTTPQEQFGHEIGADYVLPNYTQLTEYWKKLDRESDRMRLQSIGKTAEGRDQWMAILTAPENFKRLDRYREISRRLALAEALTDEQARQLAAEGKAVVWIDGGLHANEVLGAQQLMELVYQMTSRNDPETLRILREVVLLAVHANPDGMELVSNWYMREKEPAKRSTTGLPRLYQKYVGHDNNRDFYFSAQPETTNMNRVMYVEWIPQIMYNHHQTGPAGAVLFAPPFRDPFNYYFDPLIPIGIDMVGAAIHGRFAAEGKPGATMRRGANYSTWFNGGLRTTAYFHNIIGILTETIGNPTPVRIPFLPQRQLPSGDLPYPVAPQEWHFRQSIEYSMSANRAILDLASKHREELLFNIYRMGRNSIERGSRDAWTVTPKKVAAVQQAIDRDRSAPPRGAAAEAGARDATTSREAAGSGEASSPRAGAAEPQQRGTPEPGPQAQPAPAAAGGFRARGVDPKYFALLREPKARDPRGYVIPADQADFLTAIKFVNALLKTGVTVHRATAPFAASGRSYPAGSLVVKTAQAFRPHVLDMFEPQDHPNDLQYPGGPPIPPYDNAGYTLAYQMGVQFDRILEPFDAPLERVSGLLSPPAGKLTTTPEAAGYLLSHVPNDAFVLVNRLLKSGAEVFWLKQAGTTGSTSYDAGTMFIPAKAGALPILQIAAAEVGLSLQAVARRPPGDLLRLRPVRIGLWDRYGGSMPSGWLRFLFEQFEFPFELVYPQTLDAGDLKRRFDVLVFVTGAVPNREGREGGPRGGGQAGGGAAGGGTTGGEAPDAGRAPDNLPAEYKGWLGSVTVAKTIPQLRKFVEDGGVLIAIGSSTSLAHHFGLPVADALVEKTPEGERSLPREKFYVPGSVLRAAVDNTRPVAYGLPSQVDVFFDNSPAFELLPEAPLKGLRAVAWFDGAEPLRSGWAWGQHYLKGSVAIVEAPVGKGTVFLFGPEITFRGQPHGTFKFLFNAVYGGTAHPVSDPLQDAPAAGQAAR